MQLQYIGARYVPIFYHNSLDDSADWESNVEYEPMTFVTLPNNHLYMSKKLVPETVGTPASNIEYWLDMGVFSGSYVDLLNKIGNLSNLNTTDQTDLVSAINEVLADNNALETRFNNVIDPEKIIIFGDSWVDYTHDSSNVYIPKMFHDQFGCTIHNYSYGGTGFDVPNGYDEQITWFAADNIDVDKIKFVFLCAGLNEYEAGTHSSDFLAKLEDWYDKLYAVVGRHIPVYWIASYSIANNYTATNPTTYFNQYNYYNNIRIGLKKPIKYIDIMGMVSNSWRNNSHPNQAGYIRLAENLVKVINGIDPQRYPYDILSGTISDSNLPSGFRNVSARFFAHGPYMECELQYAMGAMGQVAHQSLIEFNKNMPAKPINALYLDEGCVVTVEADDKFKILVTNSGVRTWTTSMSGFQLKDFKIMS